MKRMSMKREATISICHQDYWRDTGQEYWARVVYALVSKDDGDSGWGRGFATSGIVGYGL